MWEKEFTHFTSSADQNLGTKFIFLELLVSSVLTRIFPPYLKTTWEAVPLAVNHPNFGLVNGPYHPQYEQNHLPSQLSIDMGLNKALCSEEQKEQC